MSFCWRIPIHPISDLAASSAIKTPSSSTHGQTGTRYPGDPPPRADRADPVEPGNSTLMISLRLISHPPWASPFSRSADEKFGADNLQLALAQREAILAAVHQAVQAYLDDRSLTSGSAVCGFPALEMLTGEYYIASESYRVNDEPWFPRVGRSKEYRLSFLVHCLGRHSHPHETASDQDYLGLDVHFDWLPDRGTFAYHGDIDSSVL